MDNPRYVKLARLIQARINCIESENVEWIDKHDESIDKIMETAPSGSGFDNGTKLSFQKSTGKKLVFYTSFHHMDENGFYDGWTEHEITVRPCLQFGFDLRIGGQNRNDIKDYISETFVCWLHEKGE